MDSLSWLFGEESKNISTFTKLPNFMCRLIFDRVIHFITISHTQFFIIVRAYILINTQGNAPK